MATVKRIKLGSQGLEVSAQGLGCMGMSAFYGPPKPEPEMIALIHHAIKSGVTFLDTCYVYGPHTNEILLGKMKIHGDPAYVRAACEASLKRLGVDCIDLYYQHRIDTQVPTEVTQNRKLHQNIKALSVKLTPEDMAELESIAAADAVKGERCMSSDFSSSKDSETPPLSSWKAS
ncbi:hypothetical protein Patl1_24180 [Pistacia atlantica]|uniref:Uncharacterized protein n=1 Tax=Pistacia atlantica TaxID=434234 RepID=A0ACC1A334_9ROSI|nr:hypothetical protein Patl1_24180 [Pistacia atlantica]